MSGVVNQESSNPAWRAIENTGEFAGNPANAMTMTGTVGKTGVLLGLLLASGLISFGYATDVITEGGNLPVGLVAGGIIGALVAGLVLAFKPSLAPFLAPVYAGLEGMALGAITAVVEKFKPGIGVEAITLTAGILGGMLFLYYNGALRATPFLTKAIGASMLAILVAYLATWIGRMLGYEIPYIHGNGIIGIGFSLFVVGVASFSFILDFAQIERHIYEQSPKYMEWYCGYCLMVTVVWLYMELVKLLMKLNSRD
jgi:uncharacterized YccA/Bax inhibitor family protein